MGDRIAQTLFLPYVVKFWTQSSELLAVCRVKFSVLANLGQQKRLQSPSLTSSGNYKFNKWVMAERYGGDKLLGNSANHRVTM